LSVEPLLQDHGIGLTTGLRFGPFAYSTDLVDLPESSFARLHGLDLWIVGCFSSREHPTHVHVDKALSWIERLKPKRALITHMSPALDYADLAARLPENVSPAYDGQVIEV
jgi:phosphoribosyl 1,2-cyclic phosphate phosphodiesterase